MNKPDSQCADLAASFDSALNAVRDLGTTAPRKYDRLKRSIKRDTGAEVAVCYMSDISRMWTPRVGQALLSLPQGLVLLSSDSFKNTAHGGDSYLDKVEKVLRGADRVELAIACTGWEGDWTVECIVGPDDSLVCDLFERAFPSVEHRRFLRAPMKRLPDPR